MSRGAPRGLCLSIAPVSSFSRGTAVAEGLAGFANKKGDFTNMGVAGVGSGHFVVS